MNGTKSVKNDYTISDFLKVTFVRRVPDWPRPRPRCCCCCCRYAAVGTTYERRQNGSNCRRM